MSGNYLPVSGQEFNALGNELLDVLVKHCIGLEPGEVLCVAAATVADFGRIHFGDESLERLAALILRRGELPLPTWKQTQ